MTVEWVESGPHGPGVVVEPADGEPYWRSEKGMAEELAGTAPFALLPTVDRPDEGHWFARRVVLALLRLGWVPPR